MSKQVRWVQKGRGRLSEEGFALPIAIGVGLIMLLLGVTMIVRSQNDQVNASAQKATARSLAAAESGVSKVQTFLNRYRILATYPNEGSADWTTVCPGQVDSDEIDALFPDGGGDWPNIDPDDPNPAQPVNGEFRVVRYDYATPGQPNARGVLTIQGRVNAGEPSESTSQLQVSIPTQPVTQVAALWVQSSITGNLEVNGTVVGPCGQTLAVAGPSVNVVSQSPLANAFPSLPEPDSSAAALPSDPTTVLGQGDPNKKYVTPDLSRSLTVWTGSDVEIWVEGDIDLTGQTIKCVQPDGAGGQSPCASTDTFKVNIYGQGTSNRLRLDESSVLCNVFFHAPQYDVEANSSSSTSDNCGTPDTQLVGAFWVNSWSGGPGSISLQQIVSDAPALRATLPPQIAPIARWETQEAESP